MDLIDDPVPLLMSKNPCLSEQDARTAARGCVGESTLEEDDDAGAVLIERTYYLPGGGTCVLWAMGWVSGCARDGDFDVDREDLYPNEGAARAAWDEDAR